LGHFKREFRDKILNEISKSLSEEGDYIQFQYALVDIVGIKNIFSNVKISYELLNFPPAFVIRCKKIKK
jgi:phospholipid N-methyltransferase